MATSSKDGMASTVQFQPTFVTPPVEAKDKDGSSQKKKTQQTNQIVTEQ